jgi:putative Mn2+ efflux pump MntP
MDTHVKVLGALQIAFGALGLLGAVMIVFVFGGAAGIVGASDNPDASIAVPIIGLTGMAMVVFLLLTSLPSVIIGIGLLKHSPWARIAGIVLSIVSLIMIPFGTVIGVYGLWVLFSKDTERLFTAPAAPV